MSLTWKAALAWRAGRHFLVGERAASVPAVVRRLLAVPAWSGDPALAIGIRLAHPRDGDLDRALADGSILKAYAYRGATHLMAPDLAATTLALRASSRQWELPSWRTHYGIEPDDWPALRETVRDVLLGGPLTRQELAAAVTASPRFGHVGHAFVDSADTLLKPFMWQGDVVFGPDRDGQATVRTLDGIAGWHGPASLEDAGPAAIGGYLGAYGPATSERIQYWLGAGLSAGRRRIDGWIATLLGQGRIVELDIEGDAALARAEDADALAAARSDAYVRLIPGYDQWVLGPGTADPIVVPPQLRPLATRGANLVLVDGRVAGSWRLSKRELIIEVPDSTASDADLIAEGTRIAALSGRDVPIRVGRP